MRDVVDPELGINVVDLGLVYDLRVEPAARRADTASDHDRHDADVRGLPAHRRHRGPGHAALTGGPSPLAVEIKINWVWLPPWGPDKITDDGREQLRALGFNV